MPAATRPILAVVGNARLPLTVRVLVAGLNARPVDTPVILLPEVLRLLNWG